MGDDLRGDAKLEFKFAQGVARLLEIRQRAQEGSHGLLQLSLAESLQLRELLPWERGDAARMVDQGLLRRLGIVVRAHGASPRSLHFSAQTQLDMTLKRNLLRRCRPTGYRATCSRPAMWSFIILSCSGACPVQSMTSPMTRSASMVRYDFVALPGNFLSVRSGSSSNAPVR